MKTFGCEALDEEDAEDVTVFSYILAELRKIEKDEYDKMKNKR